jgi:hypothetical protein
MLTHALNSIQLINPYPPADLVSTAVNGLFTYSTVHNFSEKKKKSISVNMFRFTKSLKFAGNVHLKAEFTFPAAHC